MSLPAGQAIKQIQELMKEELYTEAIELCNEALIENDNGIILHLKGISLYYLGQFEQAIFAFTRATQQPDFTSESWTHLALLQMELLKLEPAKIALLRATQLAPNYAYNWALRAIYREWQQDFIGSERSYTHAHWLAPDIIPELPEFQPIETEQEIKNILIARGFSPENVEEGLSIQFQLGPVLSQLEQNLNRISPLHLSFHFEEQAQKGYLTGFQKNILRGIAENVPLEEQLETILPEIEDYLDIWYQRQP